jgi:hypothetical protein
MKKQELVLPYFNLRKNLNDAPQEKKRIYKIVIGLWLDISFQLCCGWKLEGIRLSNSTYNMNVKLNLVRNSIFSEIYIDRLKHLPKRHEFRRKSRMSPTM